LQMAISLLELRELGTALGIPIRVLFSDEPPTTLQISPERLVEVIKKYLSETGMTISEFEDRVGFFIAPILEDPSEFFKWNADCLRFVCQEIGVDWVSALP